MSSGKGTLMEEIPEAYKNLDEVVECSSGGHFQKGGRLRAVGCSRDNVWLRKKPGCCGCASPSSLQRMSEYASLLRVRAPCLRSFFGAAIIYDA